MSEEIKDGDTVQVLEGAKPSRIVGRVGVVVSLCHFPSPHSFTQADVKFSDAFGDKYAVRTTNLRICEPK